MKPSILSFLSVTLFAPVNTHYVFPRLIANNTITGQWEYVREISGFLEDGWDHGPDFWMEDPMKPEVRCNRNASTGHGKTKTATIRAGDKVGFTVGGDWRSEESKRLYHPGVGTAWLSKCPGCGVDGMDLDKYEGDGDWFKILQVIGRTEQSINWTLPEEKNSGLYQSYFEIWGIYGVKSWNFTIPPSTPAGQYLLRFEHIFAGPRVNETQIYVSCAQLDIKASPTVSPGVPSPLVKIPGVYNRTQPDFMYNPYEYGLKNSWEGFVVPKPDVWEG